MAGPPTIIIHNLEHAVAAARGAAASGIALRAESAPGAAAFAGAGWFGALIEAAEAAAPGAEVLWVLDCGAAPGLALGAVRAGIPALRLSAPKAVRSKVAEIAAAAGCRLIEGGAGPRLDLLDAADPEAEVSRFLARIGPRR